MLNEFKMLNRKVSKGAKMNSFKITKTVEIEQDYNELLLEEKRLESQIYHLQRELNATQSSLDEIKEIKIEIEQS